jgi:hypothetical protein
MPGKTCRADSQDWKIRGKGLSLIQLVGLPNGNPKITVPAQSMLVVSASIYGL